MNTAFKWVALGALFLIPFLPLYVEGSLFFPFISGKNFAFRILVEIATGSWLLLALADKRYRPRFSWTLLIYTALVVWMFVADLVAPNQMKAFWSNFERMDGWVTLVHVFLFFVVAGSILTVEKRWRSWWLTVLAVSAVVIGHGFLQLICAGQECANTFQIHQGGVRVDANLGNAAYLAAYLLFTIAVALWQAVVSKGWLRYTLIVLAFLQAVVLFSTATRGAILAFVGAIGLGALLWMFHAGKAGRRIGVGVLAGLLLIIGGFLALKDTDFVRNDPVLTRIASISISDGNVRFKLWDMALQGFSERPITGWGHEGFLFVFTKYYDPALYAQEPWFDRAHSVYFDWLVSGGAPALILFLALLISGVVALYRSNVSRAERVMLIAAMAAYAFQALFVFDNLMTYVLLAAILAAAHEASSRPIKRFEELPEVKQSSITPVALPVVLVVLAGVIWIVNINNILAGQALIRAAISVDPVVALSYYREALDKHSFAEQEIREQMVIYASNLARRQEVPLQVKQEAVGIAFTEIEKQLQRVPGDVRVRLQYASGLEGIGNYKDALAQVEQAETLAPRKQALILQKGMVLWRLKDFEGARKAFESAYALDEGYDEAVLYVASGKIITKDLKGAQELLLARFGTTTIDHDLMRFAYYEAKEYGELVKSSELHLAHAPSDPMVWFELAQAYAAAGRLADTKRVVAELVQKFPDQEALANEFLRQLSAPQ